MISSVCLLIPAGCSASAEPEHMVSMTEYATVTSADHSTITMAIGSSRLFRVIQIGTDVVILRNMDVISADELQVKDTLMCTYTNGQLSVIEVISENTDSR